MTTAPLKISKGQLESIRRLLKGDRMCDSKAMGLHYLPATGGSSFDAPRFARATLEGLKANEVVVVAKEWGGSTDYVLNESLREQMQALLDTATAQKMLYKLSPTQMFVVERMKKGWTLRFDSGGFFLTEPPPKYGRRMVDTIARATVQALQSLDILELGEKQNRRQAYHLNQDVMVKAGL